jgi:hypothetical protein
MLVNQPVQTPEGQIKEEYFKYWDEKYGVWVHYSPEFIDPLSVPKEYRAGVLGYYWEHPEEAIDEFNQDENPSAKKTNRAMLALAWKGNEIPRKKKLDFISSYASAIGISSLIMGEGNTLINLAIVMLAEEEELDLMGMVALCLLIGMKNSGPDPFTQMLQERVANNNAFQEALSYVNEHKDKPYKEVLWNIEHNLDRRDIPKFDVSR